MTTKPSTHTTHKPRRHTRRAIGFALGLALLAAAVAAAALQGDPVAVLAPLASANPILLVLLIAATALTPVVTAIAFWTTTVRYGPPTSRVTTTEMTALIAAAWLLNYLPLWPGMFTRLAYHKKINRIPVRDAVKGIIWANAVNIASALILTATLVTAPLLTTSQTTIAVLAAAPSLIALIVALAPAVTAPARTAAPRLHLITLCLAIRHAEHHLWALRYWLVFALLDRPITWTAALALAALATLAKAVPIAPNGVGIRTWAAGATVTVLAALNLPVESTTPPADAQPLLTLALTADLTVLAVELAVAVPMGLAASAYIAARTQRHTRRRRNHHNTNSATDHHADIS